MSILRGVAGGVAALGLITTACSDGGSDRVEDLALTGNVVRAGPVLSPTPSPPAPATPSSRPAAPPPLTAATYRQQRIALALAIARQQDALSTVAAVLTKSDDREAARAATIEIKRRVAQARALHPPACYAAHREADLRYLDAVEQAVDNTLSAIEAAAEHLTTATAHLTEATEAVRNALALQRTATALFETAHC